MARSDRRGAEGAEGEGEIQGVSQRRSWGICARTRKNLTNGGIRLDAMEPSRVVRVDGNATVLDASRVMREWHVDWVVVTEAGRGGAVPLGVLSAREIVDRVVAVGLDANVVTAGDVLSLGAG
jgi:hypothetical protein